MHDLQIKTTLDFESVFNNYPDPVHKKMIALRRLIHETAKEIESITHLEETLKWGEPSFLVKKGSTIRIDWKKSKPKQYAMYLQCTSKLIPTFRMVYENILEFEGSRAIVFKIHDEIPKTELKNCIKAALTYHKVKHLPTLGI